MNHLKWVCNLDQVVKYKFFNRLPSFSDVWCDEALIHQPNSSFIEITVTVFTKSATAPNLYFLRARSPFSTHSETVSLDSHPLRRLIHVPRVLVRLAELGGLKREWCWWLFLEDISVSAPCRTGCWRVTWQVLNPSEDECTHTYTQARYTLLPLLTLLSSHPLTQHSSVSRWKPATLCLLMGGVTESSEIPIDTHRVWGTEEGESSIYTTTQAHSRLWAESRNGSWGDCGVSLRRSPVGFQTPGRSWAAKTSTGGQGTVDLIYVYACSMLQSSLLPR